MKRLFCSLLIIVSLLFLASCDRIEEPGGKITPIFTKVLLTGDTDVVYEDSIKGNYLPGHTVELKTHVLMDADIEVYMDGVRIPKTHYDSDYWGYKFIIPSNNETYSVTLDIMVVDGFKIVYPFDYYQYRNLVNPSFINEPDFLTSLEMEERYVYPFSNYSEFVTFSNKHLGYVVNIGEDLVEVYPDEYIDTYYKIILVARRSNYNGRYKYYDYNFIDGTIKEDIYVATFEEVVIFDFVLVEYKVYVTFNE